MGENHKSKKKIVISLLIAATFLLSSVSVMANNGYDAAEENEASDLRIRENNPQTTDLPDIEEITADFSKAQDKATKIKLNNNPVSLDDDGCYPVDVTGISLDGIYHDTGDVVATGTYPLDVEVCKTEWDLCCQDWTVIDVDTTAELDVLDPRPMQPVTVEVKCDLDYVYFKFTSEGTNPGGDFYNMGDVKIRLRGDLGNRWYYAYDGDPAVYWGVNVIPGAVSTRSGGYPDPVPDVVELMIPRDGYWADCCEDVEWRGYVYNLGNPLNYNQFPDSGWYENPCDCDMYPAQVKKFIEVYEYKSSEDPDQTEEVYCEDFEDPCEIYENWATIDMPVYGYNGALDTWTWTDKRSSSPDHSMHSTSFDTYLMNQMDMLKLGFGGAGLDVSAYDEIQICWQQFVEGDAVELADGTILIQDYGYFQYSFDDATWIDAGEKYYDSEGAWEEICIDIDLDKTSALDDTVYFRWIWTSDPAFCYEGWYIDDVCVYGTIEGSFTEWWDFVMDSHSWPQWIEGECEEYVFPEQWTVTEEGTYKICGWLEALDPCHYSSTPYDDPYCIIIEVGNIKELELDCASISITPASPAWEGDDILSSVDVCNVGTLDAEDVQVQMKVQRGTYESAFYEGFEGLTNEPDGLLKSWTATEDYADEWVKSSDTQPGRSYEHFTAYDSSEGTQALANFNPNTAQPWRYDYIGYSSDYTRGPLGDFVSTDKDAGLEITFDSKINIGAGELFYFGVWDWTIGSGYFYSIAGPTYYDWTTQTFSGASLIDSLTGDPAYDPSDEFALGFLLVKDGADFGDPTCPWDSEWSGFMVDNIYYEKLTAQEDVVYEQTKVIPDIPITTCETVNFDWPDADVGNFVFTYTILSADSDASNNECVVPYQIINVQKEVEFDECVDYTGQGDGHWVEEGCCGGYFWVGDPATTTYGNNWDDCLYLKDPVDGDITHDLSAYANICIEFDTWFQLTSNDIGYVEISLDGGETFLIGGVYYGDSTAPIWMADAFGWFHDIICGPTSDEMQVRFRFESNETQVNRGWYVDNIEVNDGTNPLFGPDPCLDFTNFYRTERSFGCWWNEPCIWQYFIYDLGYLPDFAGYGDGALEPSNGCYDQEIYDVVRPWFGAAPDNLDNAYVGTLDVEKVFYGWLETTTYYDTDANDIGTIDISRDGTNWDTLAAYQGSANDDYQGGLLSLGTVIANDYMYWGDLYADITDYLDETELGIRLRYQSDAVNLHAYAGFGTLFGFNFYGMKDTNAPQTTVELLGTFDETFHYWTTEVGVKLTATDDLTGVATTYYELDGVVSEYTGPFVIDEDGEHTLCYWSVDNEGNEEAKQCVAPFRIDLTGPQVTITEPTDGLYLFGNKLMDLDGKIIALFGGIPVAATVTIDEAPLATVEFYLDGTLFAEDTAAPFSVVCKEKHSGAAEFKVTARDILGNEDTETIQVDNYLKLF